jgi:hypothetical protein
MINGVHSVVGSNRNAVMNTLDAAARETHDMLEVEPRESGLSLRVADTTEPVTLWMVVYRTETRVQINQGENGGRTLDYVNVVERMEPVADVSGKILTTGADVTLSREVMALEKGQNCALILQKGTPDKPGPMLSAAVVESN